MLCSARVCCIGPDGRPTWVPAKKETGVAAQLDDGNVEQLDDQARYSGGMIIESNLFFVGQVMYFGKMS